VVFEDATLKPPQHNSPQPSLQHRSGLLHGNALAFHEKIYDKLVESVIAKLKATKLGPASITTRRWGANFKGPV